MHPAESCQEVEGMQIFPWAKLYTEVIQIYDGKLNFATDAWTSPNHKAFVAITVHLEEDSKPLCIILDIVEVAEVWIYCNWETPFTDDPIL